MQLKDKFQITFFHEMKRQFQQTFFKKKYGIGMNDRRFRHKLKKKPKERFPDELLFLTTKLNTADTVVSAKNASSYVLLDDTSCVVEAANTLM